MDLEPKTYDEALAALLALSRDGSPVVREDNAEETVHLGWRRWRSFSRRHKKLTGTFDERVEDLAKGLRDAYETDRRLVGPLMTDYRHLARVLGTVFTNS